MQRQGCRMLSRPYSKGNISLTILVIALVLLSVSCSLLQLVRQEAEAAYEDIRTRQLYDLTASAIRASIAGEQENPLRDMEISDIILQPGGAVAAIKQTVKENQAAGLRLLTITTTDSEDNSCRLQQIRYTPPAAVAAQALEHALIATGSVEKPCDTWSALLYTSGAVFPEFNIKDYSGWTNGSFPTTATLQQSGLGGRMYFDDTSLLKLAKGSKIKGQGFIVLKNVANIEDDCSFEDRIVILANGNLTIGNRVTLNKALIICRGTLRIGADCTIKGVILVKGNTIIGNNFTLMLDREAASPFSTIIY